MKARRFSDLSPMKTLIFTILVCVVAACSPGKPLPPEPCFFWWETTLNLSEPERALMDSLHCKKLYVKVLDIGRNTATGAIEPYSLTSLHDSAGLEKLSIIPCIFLTNEVFQHISTEKMDWLAGKIAASAPFAHQNFDAVLIDCDWTASTREAFFLFLQKFRKQLPKSTQLCATIRLHQYKFPQQTGVPPVDRGMLMFYNTGDVDEEQERSAIFHPDDALKYLLGAPKHYPLPLDLALPLFSWALVYREGELWKIVPGPLPLEAMRQSGKYVEHRSLEAFPAELWEVREGTFLGGQYLRPGDRLRVSQVSAQNLFAIASLAQKLDLAEDASVAFFHLGIAEPAHFSATLLDSLCKSLRK